MDNNTEKEDRMLLALAEDRMREAFEEGIPGYTGFLDSRQCALVSSHLRSLGRSCLLFGGYENAERRVAAFLPDYMNEQSLYEEDGPLAILRVSVPKGSKPLSHRDYLGSLMALGIKREVTGDIIVRENGADIIILRDMADFLLSEYAKAGRSALSTSVVPLAGLDISEIRTEDIRDSVASVRLDAVCSSAFKMARGKAQEAIRQGLVSVNGLQCLKPDFQPEEGDSIAMRGKGKAVLSEIGGTSRKGRLYILIKRFL